MTAKSNLTLNLDAHRFDVLALRVRGKGFFVCFCFLFFVLCFHVCFSSLFLASCVFGVPEGLR